MVVFSIGCVTLSVASGLVSTMSAATASDTPEASDAKALIGNDEANNNTDNKTAVNFFINRPP